MPMDIPKCCFATHSECFAEHAAEQRPIIAYERHKLRGKDAHVNCIRLGCIFRVILLFFIWIFFNLLLLAERKSKKPHTHFGLFEDINYLIVSLSETFTLLVEDKCKLVCAPLSHCAQGHRLVLKVNSAITYWRVKIILVRRFRSFVGVFIGASVLFLCLVWIRLHCGFSLGEL